MSSKMSSIRDRFNSFVTMKAMSLRTKEELEDDDIGLPFSLNHVRHIDVDQRSSTGFTGLPDK